METVLEIILSHFAKDDEALRGFRLVGWLRNQVAVRVLDQLTSNCPSFLTDQLMKEFVHDMNLGCLDFAFSRVRFRNLNSQNVTTAIQLLRTGSRHFVGVDIVTLQDSMETEMMTDFLSNLDPSTMPFLEELQFGTIFWPRMVEPLPILNLSNLRTLRLPSTFVPLESIPAWLVDSAPNLQLLQIKFKPNLCRAMTDLTPVWQLPDQFKQIPLIELTLVVQFDGFPSLEKLRLLREKLDEWVNVQVDSLTMRVLPDLFGDAHEIRNHISRILQLHSPHIKYLGISAFLRWNPEFPGGRMRMARNLNRHNLPALPNTPPNITLPDMSSVTRLEFRFTHPCSISPILGNPFARLKEVAIYSYNHPAAFLQSAVLESVAILTVYENEDTLDRVRNLPQQVSHLAFNEIFPNLTAFTYINLDTSGLINCDNLLHLVTTMRMDSLSSVKYMLVTNAKPPSSKPDVWSPISTIFSGLRDLPYIIEKANDAKYNGGDAEEEQFWEEMEQTRLPCVANMAGLKSFWLDFPVDDKFVRGVLLRMKPLEKLSLAAEGVSFPVFLRLIAQHHSFCSISVAANQGLPLDTLI